MPYTVTTYTSPEALSNAIGLPVTANIDDEQVSNLARAAGDLLICGGGLFTYIGASVPATMQILAKGLYYTVIEQTP